MKAFKLLFILSIITQLGCTYRKEFDFDIDVEQWTAGYTVNRLILTNSSGEIVKVLENIDNSLHIKESIPYASKDPENETLDFHWVLGDQNGDFVFVFSTLGVHNGEHTVMRADGTSNAYNPSVRKVVLLVDGIPMQGSGWDMEFPGVSSWNLNLPNNGDLGIAVDIDRKSGLYFRAKKFGTFLWKEFYVPDSLVQDTIHTKIADFKPEEPYIHIPFSGIDVSDISGLEMTALSPDLQHFTALKTTGSYDPSNPDHPGYVLPAGLLAPAALRTYAYSWTNNSLWLYDKIVKKGETLEIHRPDLFVRNKKSDPGKSIAFGVEGGPDVVRAYQNLQENSRYLFWSIEGRPDDFRSYNLPDILSYLPPWIKKDSIFTEFTVEAIRFDNLDFQQYRSGLPDKSPEAFAYAKSGYSYISD